MTIGVGILAGGRGRRLGQSEPKAFVWAGGHELWAHTFVAALGVTQASIPIVLPKGRKVQHGRAVCLQSTGSYMGDLFQLVKYGTGFDRFLVINADSVMVTAESLRTFLALTEHSQAGFIWPAIRRNSIPPELRKTVLNDLPGNPNLIRSGVMLFRPELLHLNQQILRKITGEYDNHKKHPLAFLVRIYQRGEMEFYRRYAELPLLGLRNCLMWALKLLNLEEVKSCMGKCFGCKVEMPELHIGEFGFDVDLPSELELADHYFETRRRLDAMAERAVASLRNSES